MRRVTTLVLALVLFAPLIPTTIAQETNRAEVVEGNTAFAFDLYGELLDDSDGNLLISPYSVSQALAMTYAGAEGETATQMAEVLGFTLAQPDLHKALSSLNFDLSARGNHEKDPDSGQPARVLNIANALWGEQTYPFSDAFIAQLSEHYGAGLRLIDFHNAPEPSRQEINNWVAEQTEDRIQDIVPEGEITLCTRLVLANAIYFYGGWEDPFYPGATEDDDFFLLDGTTVIVPFMVQQESLPYARGEGFQAIEFPYAGSRFAFTVILPDEGQFDVVEAGLDAGALESTVNRLSRTDVWVYLPKFEFATDSLSLGPPLQSLGMTDAFDPWSADFDGMLAGPLPEADPRCFVDGIPPRTLAISNVFHKAFISLGEKGTEAAAATTVLMSPVPGATAMPTEPLEVRIDRPFLFAIRDTQTGTLLFLGRVMDPSLAA
jgi:serpin B